MTTMTQSGFDIEQLFKQYGALLEGHFKLSSGLHSGRYLQAAKVLQYPQIAGQLGRALAAQFKDDAIQVVLAPALGGILVAHEVGRALGVRAIFVERQTGQAFQLRRGFEIRPRERVLVVEDVVTTGKSTREVIDVVRNGSGVLAGVGSIIDRSESAQDFGVPFRSLGKVHVDTYNPAECPLCVKGIPAIKPGSRA